MVVLWSPQPGLDIPATDHDKVRAGFCGAKELDRYTEYDAEYDAYHNTTDTVNGDDAMMVVVDIGNSRVAPRFFSQASQPVSQLPLFISSAHITVASLEICRRTRPTSHAPTSHHAPLAANRDPSAYYLLSRSPYSRQQKSAI